ncbi:translation initiation factor IF-2 subunit beta, partial [Candidatus Parvarchaeota archaeon]|nr:translation initiation factor IF-2 subunit beta [Candidatus Parvarchaeota archaeon]
MDYEKLLDRAYAALPHKSEVSERFEMPVAETFLQGSKTIFKNFDSIVGKIRREPELLTKYFSKELAVPCTVAGGKLTLHGKFYDRTINEKLSDFIN